jgi:hypothetical protein
MDIISLLPFIIFILFVGLTIYRTRQRLKSLGKPNKNIVKPKNLRLRSEKNEIVKKSGWKNIMIEAYEQIQEELRRVQEDKNKYDKTGIRKETSKPAILWEKDLVIASPPPIPSSKETKKKKAASQSPKPELIKLQEPTVPKTDPFSIKEPTTNDLRKAVVWSEILAPPVALRENQDLF